VVRCPDGHESVSEDYCDVCGLQIGGTSPVPGPEAQASGVAASAGPGASAGLGASAVGAGASAGVGASAAGADAAAGLGASAAGADAASELCPVCQRVRSGGVFCEGCGFNFSTRTPAVQTAAMEVPPVTAAPPDPSAPVPSAVAAFPDAVSIPTAPHQVPTAQPGWTAVVAADRAYYDKVEAEAGPGGSGIDFPGYCPERRFDLIGTEMRIGRRSPSRGLNPEIDLTGPPTDPGISRLHAVLIATADGWAVLDPGSANGTSLNGTDIGNDVQFPLHDGDQITLGAWTTITIHGQ